jgi:hypothetical protein
MTTTSTPSNNTLAVINSSIALVSALVPEVGILIAGVKAIWFAANPGQSDAQWIASLATAAGTLTSAADQQLLKDGYTTVDGGLTWIPPVRPPA